MPLKGEARIMNQRRELGQPNPERALERVRHAIYFLDGAAKDLPDGELKARMITHRNVTEEILKEMERA